VEKAESNGMDNLYRRKEQIIRELEDKVQELETKLETIRRAIG